jgi:hypothetical protein
LKSEAKIWKNYEKKIKKYATINTGYDVKRTVQPIRDKTYHHLPSKPIRDEVAGDKRRGTFSSLVCVLLLGHYSTVPVCEF